MMYSFKALCGVTDPKKCPDLWGVFSYMPNRSLGECATLNGTWCLDGKNTMAIPGQNTYYALCASAIGEHFYLVNAYMIIQYAETTTLLHSDAGNNIYKVFVDIQCCIPA